MAPKNEASIWQPRFATNLSANTKQVEEAMIALQDQETFLLETFTYAKNTGSLTVYKNGELINKNEDWRELSPASQDDDEADSFQLLVPAKAGDIITAIGLTEIRGVVKTEAGSVILPSPPDFTEYPKASRWWDCRTGKSYIAVENSTGYKQWVEERSPVDPPNYEVTTFSTPLTELTVTGTYHAKLVELTSDEDIVITVGEALDANGQFVGAIIFIQNIGYGDCTVVPAAGVTVTSNSTNKLEGQGSTVALIAKSEKSWVLMGNLEVV